MLAYLQSNLVGFVLVLIATSLSHVFQPSVYSDSGNYLWFPLGAVVLSYLLFEHKAILGVFIGTMISGVIFADGWSSVGGYRFGLIESAIAVIAPYLAYLSMHKFQLSPFFANYKINFRHIVFLVILAATYDAMFKFSHFLMTVESDITPALLMRHYLLGEIVGGVIFVVLLLKLFDIFVKTLR